MIHSNCRIWVSTTEPYKLEVASTDVSTIGRDVVNILSVAVESLKDGAHRPFKKIRPYNIIKNGIVAHSGSGVFL